MKGFTLIELLAVIVILAIIALIATPIVLSIINDSKESSIIRSGEFYIDAVKNSIMQENMKLGGTLNPSECIIDNNGNATCDGTLLEIEVDGEKPSGGSITFNEGKATGVNLTFGNKNLSMSPSGQLVIGEFQLCKLISGNANEVGSKYECEVKPGTKYNFYVLSHEEDGTTNLIMDRNICEDGTVATEDNTCTVVWITEEDYGCVKDAGDLFSCAENDKGPITAIKYLNNATSTWSNINNLNITYDDEGGNFTDFEINGKARLPYLSEVDVYNGSNAYLYEHLDGSEWWAIGNKPDNNIDGIFSYWITDSSSSGTECVSSVGEVHPSDVYYDSGVRPVINVKL